MGGSVLSRSLPHRGRRSALGYSGGGGKLTGALAGGGCLGKAVASIIGYGTAPGLGPRAALEAVRDRVLSARLGERDGRGIVSELTSEKRQAGSRILTASETRMRS